MAVAYSKTKNTILELIEKYPEFFKEIKAKAKTLLLEEGEVAKKIFFVKKGCLRTWRNHKDKEITSQFFFRKRNGCFN